MSERVYVVGDIWEDDVGDEWEVNEDGLLDCEVVRWFNYSPERVENLWGPLVLKKPAENSETPWMEACELDEIFSFKIPNNISRRMDTRFVEDAAGIYESALNVLLRKNADYGSKNIAESPGGALNGLRVRMWDKIARINHLMDSGAEPENESLRDSFLDIGNYAFIALMVLDGNWPGTGEDK